MTTRIEFIIDVDDDFSEAMQGSDTNTLENKHFDLLAKIKNKIEATLDSLGYEIERSRLNIYEVSGTFIDKTKSDEGDFIIKEQPFDFI